MIRFFARIGRDCRATAIVELALAAPILAALVIGMVDVSRGYSTRLQLEQAAQRSIEKAMQATKATSLYVTLKAEGAEAAGVNIAAVDVQYWLECNGTKQTGSTMETAYNQNCNVGETYARYLTVEITKAYVPMFAVKMAGSNADGTYTLKGKAGIRVQ